MDFDTRPATICVGGTEPPAEVAAFGASSMADRHTIVVRIIDRRVTEVMFCDCCPCLTLEVRTYTDDADAAVMARPVWYLGGGNGSPSAFQRDERGVYRATYHEPDGDGE